MSSKTLAKESTCTKFSTKEERTITGMALFFICFRNSEDESTSVPQYRILLRGRTSSNDKHVLFLRSFDIWLVTDRMEDASPHKRNKSKIARLRILGKHFSDITIHDQRIDDTSKGSKEINSIHSKFQEPTIKAVRYGESPQNTVESCMHEGSGMSNL